MGRSGDCIFLETWLVVVALSTRGLSLPSSAWVTEAVVSDTNVHIFAICLHRRGTSLGGLETFPCDFYFLFEILCSWIKKPGTIAHFLPGGLFCASSGVDLMFVAPNAAGTISFKSNNGPRHMCHSTQGCTHLHPSWYAPAASVPRQGRMSNNVDPIILWRSP